MSRLDTHTERMLYQFALGISDANMDVSLAELRAMYASANNQLAVGEETVSRQLATASSAGLASGVVGLSYFTARKSEVSTQGKICTGSTAAAATPTLCKMGVYSVASSGDLTLVASTANDTTLFAATFTAYTKAWAASFNKIAGQRYAMAHLVVTGVARPNYLAVNTPTVNAGEFLLSPVLGAGYTGQTDLPASISAASLANIGYQFYGVVLP